MGVNIVLIQVQFIIWKFLKDKVNHVFCLATEKKEKLPLNSSLTSEKPFFNSMNDITAMICPEV